MPDDEPNPPEEQGRITHGPQLNGLVQRTLEFVQAELPHWRDYPRRSPESVEEKLNIQLSKFLNVRAREVTLPVHFHHEEKQAEQRRVDVSAGPINEELIETVLYSIFDPFLVLEGKRLPPPDGKAREKEYVTGGEKISGGIQRFKLGLHGDQLAIVAMIGYVQKNDAAYWLDQINAWIREQTTITQADGSTWALDEQLGPLSHSAELITVRSESVHSRTASVSPQVTIVHLWVEMK